MDGVVDKSALSASRDVCQINCPTDSFLVPDCWHPSLHKFGVLLTPEVIISRRGRGIEW